MQAIVSLAIGLVLLVWTGISANFLLNPCWCRLALQGISLFVAAF